MFTPMLLGFVIAFLPQCLKFIPPPTPPEYRVFYFADAAQIPASSYRAPAHIARELGAEIAFSWAAVEAVDREAPLDAVIIDRAALPFVSRGWLQNAYKRGIVIATFNTVSPELAEILDAPDLVHPDFADTPYPGDFFIILWQFRWQTPPPSRFRPGAIYDSGSRAQNQLYTAEDFKRFSSIFRQQVGQAVNTRKCQQQAGEAFLPPRWMG